MVKPNKKENLNKLIYPSISYAFFAKSLFFRKFAHKRLFKT